MQRTVLTLLAGCLLMNAAPAMAGTDSGFFTEQIEINAPPKTVLEALRKHRLVTPGRKVVSLKSDSAVVNEEFNDLPIIGKANVTYVEHETSPNEMDYKLVKSDKIKAFEGSWKMLPEAGGKHTLLKLTTMTDVGIRLPLAGTITKKAARKQAELRIAEVKRLAEAM